MNWQRGTLDEMSAKFLMHLGAESSSQHPDDALRAALRATWDTCPAAYLVGRANRVDVKVIPGKSTTTTTTTTTNGIDLAGKARGDALKATAGKSVFSRVSTWRSATSNTKEQGVGLMTSLFGTAESLVMDMDPASGGEGEAPNPVQWCLAGVGSSFAADYATLLAQKGVLCDSIATTVAAQINMRKILLGEDVPAFTDIVVSATVDGCAASLETLQQLAEEAAASSMGVMAWRNATPLKVSVAPMLSVRLN